MVQAAMWVALHGVAHAQPTEIDRVVETIASEPLDASNLDVAVVDPDCGESEERADAVTSAAARANEGDVVVVVVDGEAPTLADVVEMAEAHRVDLVVLEADVCRDADSNLEELLESLRVGTVAEAWEWGDDGERELRHSLEEAFLVVQGAGLRAVHHVQQEAPDPVGTVAVANTAVSEDWIWNVFIVFAVAVVVVFVGLVYLGLRRDRKS